MSKYILLRYREVLSFSIAEMAISNKTSFKYWHGELVKSLTAAEVDEKFCTQLMCQYSQYTEIGKLLADALSQYIRIRRPKELKFVFQDRMPCSVAQLRLFLRKVRRHHEGALELDLHHAYLNFVDTDDAIKVLLGAR